MTTPSPIAGACVWHGRDIAKSRRWIRTLAPDAIAEIDAAVRGVRRRGLAGHAVAREDFPLPRTQALLADIRDELENGVFVTAQKLLTGDIFGIEKYLPAGTPVHYVRLHDFVGRGRAIDTVLSYAEGARMRRQVRTQIAAVCEELLMNALYDAPVDAAGRPIFADIDPHDRKGTHSPRPVSIRYAATEHTFAVAVRDRLFRRGR